MTSLPRTRAGVPQQRRPAAPVDGAAPQDGEPAVTDPGLLVIPAPARRFQGAAAGVVSRLLANTIDLLVTLVVIGLGYLAVSGLVFLWSPTTFSFPAFSRTAIVVSGIVVSWVYLTTAWATTGRTYGDHVIGLLVVGRAGGGVGLVFAAARATFCIAFPIGLLWCAVSRRSASVQDVVLGTAVVYAWQGSRLRPLHPRAAPPGQ